MTIQMGFGEDAAWTLQASLRASAAVVGVLPAANTLTLGVPPDKVH